MAFIKTKDDLKAAVLACVVRKCKASSLPIPLRKVSSDFSRLWSKFDTTPRELCEALHAEGLLEVYEPVRGGTLVLSRELIEHMRTSYVDQNATPFNKLMQYQDVLTRFADHALALHSPSRKTVAQGPA
jgi:hypothetical protein